MTNIKELLTSFYNLELTEEPKLLSGGLIHATYRLETNEGSFIFQKLHDILSDNAFGEDIQNVAEHLDKKGLPTIHVKPSIHGDVHIQDGKDTWRLYTYIDGTIHESVSSSRIAKEAGSVLARFHTAMRDFSLDMQKPLKLHQSEVEHAKLMQAIQEHPDAYREIAELCDEVTKTLPRYFLPKDLPKTIIHADPKISNILFREERGYCLIDLDTMIQHSPLVDIGNAMQSWCGGNEDDEANSFNHDYYLAALQGYLSEASLSEEEKSLIPQATFLLILELTARFLADYMNDSYFGWDESRYASRKEHNLARAKGQLALYHDAKQKLGM